MDVHFLRRLRAITACLCAMLTVGFCSTAWGAGAAGKQAFERICAECHGDMGEGDKGPPLVPMIHEAQGLISIARAGKGEMPPLPRKVITDQEIQEIAAYLKSLGGGQ